MGRKSLISAPAGALLRTSLPKGNHRADTSNHPAELAGVLASKQLLSRKQVRAEYSWSERSTRRLEQRGLLVPVILFRTRLYRRIDLDRCVAAGCAAGASIISRKELT